METQGAEAIGLTSIQAPLEDYFTSSGSRAYVALSRVLSHLMTEDGYPNILSTMTQIMPQEGIVDLTKELAGGNRIIHFGLLAAAVGRCELEKPSEFFRPVGFSIRPSLLSHYLQITLYGRK